MKTTKLYSHIKLSLISVVTVLSFIVCAHSAYAWNDYLEISQPVDGDVLYLGDAIAVTTSLVDESAVPSTENDCIQVMGMVINDDHIYVNPSPDWFLVAAP